MPVEYLGSEVWVRWDGRMVRVFNQRMVQIAVHAQHLLNAAMRALHVADEPRLHRGRPVGRRQHAVAARVQLLEFLHDQVVQPLHHGQKSRRLILAGVRDRILDDLADVARPRTHDDDAIGQKNSLLDDVGDHHDALHGRNLAACTADVAGPEPINFAPQALGRKHIQRAERLIHAQQFRPARQRPRDPHALFHAA